MNTAIYEVDPDTRIVKLYNNKMLFATFDLNSDEVDLIFEDLDEDEIEYWAGDLKQYGLDTEQARRDAYKYDEH